MFFLFYDGLSTGAHSSWPQDRVSQVSNKTYPQQTAPLSDPGRAHPLLALLAKGDVCFEPESCALLHQQSPAARIPSFQGTCPLPVSSLSKQSFA